MHRTLILLRATTIGTNDTTQRFWPWRVSKFCQYSWIPRETPNVGCNHEKLLHEITRFWSQFIPHSSCNTRFCRVFWTRFLLQILYLKLFLNVPIQKAHTILNLIFQICKIDQHLKLFKESQATNHYLNIKCQFVQSVSVISFS